VTFDAQLPSGHTMLPVEGHTRGFRQKLASLTQLVSLHSTGESKGHVACAAHIITFPTQAPLPQRTSSGGHFTAGKHAASDCAQAPFSHFTHPLAHVDCDGHPVALTRQLPSAQRKGVGAQHLY